MNKYNCECDRIEAKNKNLRLKLSKIRKKFKYLMGISHQRGANGDIWINGTSLMEVMK